MRTQFSAVFWHSAVPFGVAMAAMNLVQGQYVAAALGGVLGGALFGGTMAWLNRRGEQRLARSGIAASNMDPIQERAMDLPVSVSAAFEASRQAIQSIPKARVTRESPESGELDARIGVTMRSFGENVSVRISSRSASGCRVTVRSEPRLKTTTVDYGKAVENVELFRRSILDRTGVRGGST